MGEMVVRDWSVGAVLIRDWSLALLYLAVSGVA